MKKTVVFDFDGVIHSYASGWQGIDVLPDQPVPGIREAIAEIRAAGYEVIVVSSRCVEPAGIEAIRKWLDEYGIVVDDVTMHKPPADAYIDDRAIRFDGKPENLLGEIQALVPWHKKQGTTGKLGLREIALDLLEQLRHEAPYRFWEEATSCESFMTSLLELDTFCEEYRKEIFETKEI